MRDKSKPRTAKQIKDRKMDHGYDFISPDQHHNEVKNAIAKKASKKRVKADTLKMKRRALSMA